MEIWVRKKRKRDAKKEVDRYITLRGDTLMQFEWLYRKIDLQRFILTLAKKSG